jgi:hypothetical protein
VAFASHDDAVTGDVLRTQYLLRSRSSALALRSACTCWTSACGCPSSTSTASSGSTWRGTSAPHPQPPEDHLMHLGFLGRTRGHPDQLLPVNPTPTATLVLVHSFSPRMGRGPSSCGTSLPIRSGSTSASRDAVRGVLRAADVAGWSGSTSWLTNWSRLRPAVLDELLTGGHACEDRRRTGFALPAEDLG